MKVANRENPPLPLPARPPSAATHMPPLVTMDSNGSDPYASILHLCKMATSFRLPASPPPPEPSLDNDQLEYCLFGAIPPHLLSRYLCFNPTPSTKLLTNRQEHQHRLSLTNQHSSIGDVATSATPLSQQSQPPGDGLDKNDQTTTFHGCNQGDRGFGNDICCVMNCQESLPVTPRNEERGFRIKGSFREASNLLLEEWKYLALWHMEYVDDGYIFSVMSKFRKLAFDAGETMKLRHFLMSKKPQRKDSEAKSEKYFTRSMSANGDATLAKVKNKSKGKQEELERECSESLDFIDLTEDKRTSVEKSNVHPKYSFPSGHSSKQSRSLSNARKTLFVESDGPFLKKPKHSFDSRI